MGNMRNFLPATLLLASFLLTVTVGSEPFPVEINWPPEQVLLPGSAPDRTGMKIVQQVILFESELGEGKLMFYDDPRTKRRIDYIEFRDFEGNLLVISWIDRFGVCQAAIDRGLLDPKGPRIDGIVVMIEIGTEL
jgi:hypothetical protein